MAGCQFELLKSGNSDKYDRKRTGWRPRKFLTCFVEKQDVSQSSVASSFVSSRCDRILIKNNTSCGSSAAQQKERRNKQRHKNDLVDLLCVCRENLHKNIGDQSPVIDRGDREKIHDLFCKRKC